LFSTVKNRQNIQDEQKYVVLANSAHGGFDGGAVADDGTFEKDLNLSIASCLKYQLSCLGYDIIMTREKDEALKLNSSDSEASKQGDLQKRVNIMKDNPNAIFISIHQNKFEDSSVNGFQVFSAQTEDSKNLADSIQNSWNESLGVDNPKFVKTDSRGVYILKNATVPAVIVECGFISNSEELRLLKSEEYQNKLSFIILKGVLQYSNSVS